MASSDSSGLGSRLAIAAAAFSAGALVALALSRRQEKAPAPSSATEMPKPQEVKHLIERRRTVFPKDLNGKEVPREAIEALLAAANWAPTHNLTQPWRFVVLQGDSKKRFEALTLELVAKYTPEDKRAAAVERVGGKASKTWPMISCYVAICLARVNSPKGGKPNPEWEELCSVGAAVQNMYLLATSMGVAPYWSSWQELARDAPEMKAFLGLQGEGDRCLGVFTLGMTDNFGSLRGSRGPWQDKVTWLG